MSLPKMAKNKVKPHGNSNNETPPKINNNVFIKNKSNAKPKYKPSEKVLRPKTENKIHKKVRKNQVDVQTETNQKKPFDKKQWRLKKYSKKYKLEQWEEKRKKAMLTEYYKQLKDEPKFDVQKIYEQDSDNEDRKNYVTHPDRMQVVPKSEKKLSAFKRAEQEYQRIQDEKKEKREERLKQNAERKEALHKYKKNKIDKFKKLNKRTRKGQPIMKDRMQLLFQQIQSTSV